MDNVFIGNLIQYLLPFILIVTDLWNTRSRLLTFISLIPLTSPLTVLLAIPFLRVPILGIPGYLLVFYLACWGLVYYIHLLMWVTSPVPSLTLVYAASYLWEYPINLYDLAVKGFHDAVIYHVLGLYFLVYLYKWAKPPLTETAICLLAPLLSTILVMMLIPIYDPYNPVIYWEAPYSLGAGVFAALICRAVAVASLTYCFRPREKA